MRRLAGRVLDYVSGSTHLLDGLELQETHKSFGADTSNLDKWLFANGAIAVGGDSEQVDRQEPTMLKYARAVRRLIVDDVRKVPENIREAYESVVLSREDIRKYHKGWPEKCDWQRLRDNAQIKDMGSDKHENYIERSAIALCFPLHSLWKFWLTVCVQIVGSLPYCAFRRIRGV